jgi:stress response protein YsnF
MAQTVVGFFDDAAEAQRAVEQLVSNGFDRSRIDVSSGRNSGTSVSTSGNRDNDRDNENGITRFFKNLFGDNDDEANRYSRVGMQSNSIVTVHAQSSDEAERAADLLDDYGAINVNERASQYEGTGTTGDYDRTSADYDRTTDSDYTARTGAYSDTTNTRSDIGDRTDRDRDTTINRVEEDLEVGKRTVERGGVRVRSRIVERPVEESIRLREEHVNVERNPVDRVANRDELSNFEERDIELTERAEVPVVNKEARVVEEIRLSKDVEEREETIRDTVRSTEVDVQDLSGTNDTRNTTTNNLDTDYDDDDVRNRNSRI